MLERAWYDLKSSLRSLRQRPLFLLLSIGTLALAVLINVLVFQVSDEVLFAPLPMHEPGRLVSLGNSWEGLGYEHSSLSYPEVVDQRQLEQLTAVAGYRWTSHNFAAGDGVPEHVTGLDATANALEVFGLRPLHGRSFVPEDGEAGAEPVVLLTYELFRRRFGADPSVVEKTIDISGESHRVIGVLPDGFDYPSSNVALWRAYRENPDAPEGRGWRSWSAVGRLAPGVELGALQARLETFAREQREALPAWYDKPEWGWAPSARLLRDQMTRDVRAQLLLLLAAVAVVALIAATNVANLFLSRAAERRGELAVRTAVGAERGRLIRQLSLETMVVALAGGGVGLVLSAMAGGPLRPLVEAQIGSVQMQLGWRHALFAMALCFGISLLTALIYVPAALRQARMGALRNRSEDRSASTTRRFLVVTQMATAMALLFVAVLVTRSLEALTDVHIGFEQQGVAKANIALDEGRYPDGEARRLAFDRILEELRASAGVESAGMITTIPLTGLNDNSIRVIGGAVPEEEWVYPQIRWASADYFRTLEIPLLRGRDFDSRDADGTSAVAVVNQEFESTYFPEGALGETFTFGPPGQNEPAFEIVGVVGNTRELSLDESTRAIYYLPYRQHDVRANAVLLAKSSTPEIGQAAIAEAVRRVDPRQALYDEGPLHGVVANASGTARAQSFLIAAFSLLATVMAALGLYGVLTFLVQSERRSVGVRLALGAIPAQIVAWTLRRGLALVGAGLGVGVLLCVVAARLVQSQLFGVTAMDPAGFGAVVVLLVLVALLASWFPARRASKVDPLIALREE